MLYVELPMLGCTTLSFYRPGVSARLQDGMTAGQTDLEMFR